MQKRHLLLIADLRHASPRWPSLCGALVFRGWRVSVVTPPLGANPARRLGFPAIFVEKVHVTEVGPAEDVLQPLRRFLWRRGAQKGQSLTGQMASGIQTQAGRRTFERIFRHFVALCSWPDVYFRWARPAAEEALRLLADERYDAMVSSSPHPSSHVAASLVKRMRPDIRWIADFRDLWVGNHNDPGVFWRRPIDRWWERHLLSDADAFISPTPEWAALLGKRYDRPFAWVPNGFVDYERTDVGRKRKSSGAPFTLLYTGVRYPKHQRIDLLCEALRTLKRDGIISPVSFRFVVLGPLDSGLLHLARHLGIQDLICQQEPLPRDEAKRAQAEADALLFYQWDDEGETNWISSLKLHEYVGSGPPILATGGLPSSDVSQLLRRTGRAGLCFSTRDVALWLEARMDEWRRGDTPTLPADWRDLAAHLSGVSRGLITLENVMTL